MTPHGCSDAGFLGSMQRAADDDDVRFLLPLSHRNGDAAENMPRTHQSPGRCNMTPNAMAWAQGSGSNGTGDKKMGAFS